MIAFLIAASSPQKIDPATIRKITQEFAVCVVKRHSKRASSYVLDRSLWLPRRDFETLFDPNCVPTNGVGYKVIAGKRDAMTYAFAEALVRRERPTWQFADVTNVAPLDHAVALAHNPKKQPVKLDGREAKEEAVHVAISMLGECVVRSAPQAAHDLLMTGPASAMEGRYFETLMPAAADCIEKGAAVSLTKYTLRGTIALNYYRLAKAPRMSAGGAR